MRNPIPKVALLAVVGASVACAFHEPRPAFQARVFISDRGISVPLPPPSLLAEPEQEVEVDGDLMGSDAITAGSTVHILDAVGGAEAIVDLDDDAQSFMGLLPIDLTDNCLEVWVEAADGRESETSTFHAEIVVDASGNEDVVAHVGCSPG